MKDGSEHLRKNYLDSYLMNLDPALTAGVALTPTSKKDGKADGVLSAIEISGMDLNGVDLVVLSGCESANVISGVGLLELVRAFQNAGVAVVIASLLNVMDEEGAQIMFSFYRYAYVEGFDYSTALRQAMLDMKAKGKGPAFWAPFAIFSAPGDHRI